MHNKSVSILQIHAGEKVVIQDCGIAGCNLIFSENEMGVRGHVQPENLNPENIPFQCFFCAEKKFYATRDEFQK